MTARRLTINDLQFSDPRLRRLMEHILRMTREMQLIQGLLDDGEPGQVLTKTGNNDFAGEWTAGGGSGEVNTGVNIGDGIAVFLDKNGVTLRFRTLVQGENVQIATNAENEIVISASPVAADLEPCMLAGCF